VVELQDALLANADRLLTSALAVLDHGNVGLARSLAILGMEESGKAIAIHERRVEMAYAPEGELFVNARLESLWASHQEKLELIHDFLSEERYWFGTEPANPEANVAYLGTIKAWARRHDKLKQRGFYVDIDKVGGVLAPTGVDDRESLLDVISHVHQIGWQLRLGEHIEARRQDEDAREVPPTSEVRIVEMREMFSGLPDLDEAFYESLRQGRQSRRLNNDGYRLHLPDAGSNPLENLGKPGHEAASRELMRLGEELDQREGK
jgi:AbiV family abortive infection protein